MKIEKWNRHINTTVLLMMLLACSDSSEPIAGDDIELAINGGDQQVSDVGKLTSLSVRVTRSGRPVAGVTVQWQLRDPSDTGDSGSEVARSITDANGVARADITINMGANAVFAVAEGKRIQFTVIGTVQGATQLALLPNGNGNNQVDTINARIAPYRVLLTDHANRPVAGVVVNWYLQSSGGALSTLQSITDSRGIAETTHTLGNYTGTIAVEAGITGLGRIRFHTTVTAGKPVGFSELYGNDQVGSTGTALKPYAVRVVDRNGNSVHGVRVVWSIISGGGYLSPTETVSGASGVSVIHVLGSEGAHIVTATAPDLPQQPLATFRARAVPDLVLVSTVNDFYYGWIHWFDPSNLRVGVNRPVTWLWQCTDCPPDAVVHNVTFEDDPTQPVSSPHQSSGSHTRTFTKPGIYRYRCTIHSSSFSVGPMIGRVIVDQ